MEDYNHLVSVINSFGSKCEKFETIQEPYPGVFYRKIHDDQKIKIFKRGRLCKLYLYPSFKPRNPRNNITHD